MGLPLTSFLSGSHKQVIKFKLKKEYRVWLDGKIAEYRSLDKYSLDRKHLQEIIEDQDYSSHEFIREFKSGKYTKI